MSDIKMPKLRFAEFTDNWEVKTLKNMLDMIVDNRGKTPPINDIGIPLIEVSAIGNRNVDYTKINKYVSQDTYDNWFRKYLQNGDILFSTVGETAICSIYDETTKSGIAQNIVGLRFMTENYIFMYYLLIEEKNNNQFKQIEMVAVQPSIKVSQMIELEFNIPPLQEQTKIADFLTAVDDKIQQLAQKKSLIEQYKKGVMQQLFNQTIRFKDDNGNDYPNWEVKKLGELFVGLKGVGLTKDNIVQNGKYKCILYGELYTKYQEVIRMVISSTNINDGLLSCSNDLLIPCSTTTTGIDLANVATLKIDNILLGGDITVLRSKYVLDSVFYAYYLSNYKKREIAEYAQGSTIIHLYFNHFKNMNVVVPPLLEQTKIADFLTSIDDKINQVNIQLEQTKLFKKSLLQQMLV